MSGISDPRRSNSFVFTLILDVMFDEHLWERNVADQYGLLTEEKRDHAGKLFRRRATGRS